MNEELEQMERLYQIITEFVVNYSFQILGAIFVVIIGAWIASRVGKFVEKLMTNRNIDITLSRFTGSGVKLVVLTMVIIVALGQLGISVTPFIAAIGALGLGLGLAIQGMLANYAAGFTIIITRPFVVGDTIQVQGVTGLVDQVQLGYTILVDEDDVHIQIPNRHIVGEIIHNSAGNLLVEIEVGVAYDSDVDQVIRVFREALKEVEGLDPGREPLIGIDNFGDSSINVSARFWAPTDKHYQIKYTSNQAVLNALRAANIDIPFPQREVRVLEN